MSDSTILLVRGDGKFQVMPASKESLGGRFFKVCEVARVARPETKYEERTYTIHMAEDVYGGTQYVGIEVGV